MNRWTPVTAHENPQPYADNQVEPDDALKAWLVDAENFKRNSPQRIKREPALQADLYGSKP